MRKLLITGGAGAIGSGYAEWARDRYQVTLLDLPGQFDDRHAHLGRLVEADLRQLDEIREAFDGVDTVLHLGGERHPWATWSSLLPANIVGTYNVIAAAVAAACRRVVYASSVHAVSGYPPGSGVTEDDPVHPGDLYGVTKAFGEALGSFVASTEQLSFVALRIGAFQDPRVIDAPETGWMLQDYTAPTDLYRLIDTVIDAEPLRFEIYNAVSGNTFTRLPMNKAREDFGYVPDYDSFQLSTPFREAIRAVGGVADRAMESGMREEIESSTRRKEIA
ncbi:nucleoside-diphosphate-sugar epimerase [Streptosporangium album]|uniref:Nucleoside-diphosphate-sugar epimerase n=1 Tax=Streptosporangium album TaxID=47479 RepID=A0A7W7S3T4_9ACTN|nr:NAD(P)-dependent oxidoreductase [Streptosporangium album]MBB4943371.1 nucleoside-diphosphate-sugar epimerase [Streptosporangium album]